LNNNSEHVLLSHGSGGKLMHDLVTNSIVSILGNPILNRMDDSAQLTINGRLAFTTDSYVVKPYFFTGGDIGKLSVCGTVNDLATTGAVPKYLSLSFILEEGLLLNDLNVILESIRQTADEAGVQVVTGDTKVVDKGSTDGIFINTSGLGIIPHGVNISGSNAKIGDYILLSGTIGDHGIAIMSQREGLRFESPVFSDCAPLNHLVSEAIEVSNNIHCLRDPTRGGLATTLNEIAQQSKVGIRIYEQEIPIESAVHGACEMLGLDPLYIANEGKMVAVVAASDAEIILDQFHKNKYGIKAKIIGEVVAEHPGRVVMKTPLGTSRLIEMPIGELLPRIC
jgi:hydrogenase expression/formation protein HypE